MRTSLPLSSIEPLEPRIAPATLIWDGSASELWDDGANWNLNRAPVDGDTLVFPQNAAHKINTNNLVGLDLKAIQLEGLNYVISGSDLSLSGGLTVNALAGTSSDRGPIFNPNIMLVTNAQAIANNGSVVAEVNGTITLNAALEFAGAGDVVIGGPLTGVGAISKNGTGSVKLTDPNTVGGSLTINAGTFAPDAALNISTAVTGGTLGGLGSLGAVTTSGTATIAPAGAGTGTLTMASATLGAQSTVAIDLKGTAPGTFDRLAVSGVANLGGATLALNLAFPSVATNSFTILTAAGVTGTFARLADLAIFDLAGKRFQIDYSATSVVLTDVTASFTWDGGAADNNWTTATNWVGDVAPVAGSELVFPAGVTDRQPVNDFPDGTAFAGLRFATSYTVSGNSILLGAGGLIGGTSTVALITNDITLAAPSTFEGNAGGALDTGGDIDLGTHQLTINALSNTRVSIGGVLSGTGEIHKSGGDVGRLDLMGTQTYAGTIRVSSGDILINGSLPNAALVLDSDGTAPLNNITLTGTGDVGSLTFGGATFDGSGSLKVHGNAVFGGSTTQPAKVDVSIAPTASGIRFNQLDVLGAVQLQNVSLTLASTIIPAPNDTFVIISNDGKDPVQGTFNGLPDGRVIQVGTQSFQILYRGGDGNDVALRAIVPHADINATGSLATYTDLDGDLVTIKTSRGSFAASDFTFSPTVSSLGGFQLETINLGDDGVEFSTANLAITAKRGAFGGDGRVNVGYLNATGVDLGKVTIAGDLGQIDAGDGTAAKPALASLSVQSLGEFGVATQTLIIGSLRSDFAGDVGSLTVFGNVRSAELEIAGKLGTATINGSLIGGFSVGSGAIIATGKIGAVKIGGDLVGGSTSSTGLIRSNTTIGSVAVGGSIFGGTASPFPIPFPFLSTDAGAIRAGQDLGAVTVKGSILGTALAPITISAFGAAAPSATKDVAIKSITVSGRVEFTNILAGFTLTDLLIGGSNADAQIGKISVGKNWISSNVSAGVTGVGGMIGDANDVKISEATDAPGIVSQIASVVIGGQVIGQTGTPGVMGGVFGFVAEQMGSFKVGGTAIAFAPGAHTDLFALGTARPLGNSLAPGSGDGFAVHVFEV